MAMYSLLYVDDEPALLELGKLFLENDGTMSVETQTSAKEALERIASVSFDAVISDYQMPEINGIEFLKAVRSRFPDLPFILFTGRGREEVVIEAINNGADFYLQKGGDPCAQFAELSYKVRMAIEHRRDARALQREMSFTQGIFDSVPGILYLYDSDGRLLRWNKNHETLTGYSPAELEGRYILDWFPDESDRKIISEEIERAMRDGHASAEARLATRSGKLIPFLLTARRIEIGGKAYITGIGIDITERRKALEVLEASEDKFRGIAERSSDLIYVEDENGIVTYISPSVTSILGYTPEEVTGRRGDLLVVDKDQEKIRQGRKVKRKGGSFEHFEITVKQKNGGTIVLDLLAIPIVQDGKFHGLQVIGRDVTKRHRIGGALEESEEIYRILIEHSHDGAFLEQDRQIVYCNKALAAMIGYTPEEMQGKQMLTFVTPEEHAIVLDQYACGIAREQVPGFYEFTLLHADKKTRIKVSMSVGIGTYHGRMASIGTVRDITREHLREQALTESEELYRNLADNLPDYVIVHRGGSILYANRFVLEITGLSMENLINRSIFDFIAPESRSQVREKMQQRMEGKSTGWYEVTISLPGGENRVALVNTSVITYKGSPAILIVMSDISAHKRLETSLRESEERFRVLTENSLDTIMLFDRELRHLYVNPVVIRGLGIPAADFIGKTHREMGFPDHLIRLWEDAIRGVFTTGTPAEIEFQMPSGTWADWMLAPVHGPDGSVKQVLASARVITKMKLVEETLRRVNRQVNLLNAITRHDILNQITMVQGYLALIENKSAEPVIQDYCRRLKGAAETIRGQIGFTHIYEDIGSQEPRWQNVKAVLSRLHAPAGITLSADLPPVEIFADPMLEKVFYNLLDNAARHGGTVSEVHVSGQEIPEGYVIWFEDNGNGVADTEKMRIFERGHGKNTGLGLFLVREILTITGIAIKETGTEGKGARFEMLVPREAYRLPGRQ